MVVNNMAMAAIHFLDPFEAGVWSSWHIQRCHLNIATEISWSLGSTAGFRLRLLGDLKVVCPIISQSLASWLSHREVT